MANQFEQFEKRKEDHITHALNNDTEASGFSELDRVNLVHQALPELDFAEVDIGTWQLGKSVPTPFIVSSMTAGHQDGELINERLISACHTNGWTMGVGSQRRELEDNSYRDNWRALRARFPSVRLLGNLGLSQLINTSIDDIRRLVDNLEAQAMQIHLNGLQECIQPEGTPQFKGGLHAIEHLAKTLNCPVVVKETGCGISEQVANQLKDCGIQALDVSGLGGTHWGRIEGLRSQEGQQQQAAKTFRNWGISTVQSILNVKKVQPPFEIWGSGGVRSGLDAAKLLALGASNIGFAKPMLEAAVISEAQVSELMQTIAFELRVALFCSGTKTINTFQETCGVNFTL